MGKLLELLELVDTVTISHTGNGWRQYKIKVEEGELFREIEADDLEEGLECLVEEISEDIEAVETRTDQ